MVKVLRKYNKIILVVGGSLLMIAFLMPQAIQELFGNPAKRTYATLNGKKLTAGEFQLVDREYTAVDKFMPALTKGMLGIENADHWMLMLKEAEAGGFVGEAGDSADWPLLQAIVAEEIFRQRYGQFARQAMQMLPDEARKAFQQASDMLPQLRAAAARQSGISEEQFDHALSKARGLTRMVQAFQGAARLSDARAISAKKDRIEHVVADTLIVPSDRYLPKADEPTDDELNAQFQKYRDTPEGAGDFGFGYRLPARVKVEWLTLDRAAISGAIKPDPIEANKRWRANKGKYGEDFAAAQTQIESELRQEKLDQVLGEADKFVRAELKKAVAKLEADGAYKKLPPDWDSRRPKLETVAQSAVKAVADATGVSIPLPVVTVKAASFLGERELAALEKIGRAFYRSGGRTVGFPQLAVQTKELSASGADYGLQNAVTNADLALTNAEGDKVYFTVLDSKTESAAETLAEVRDRVVQDVKKLKAFEIAKAGLDANLAAAKADGLEKLAESIDRDFPAAAPPAVEGQPAPPAPKLKVSTRAQYYREGVGGAPGAESEELRAAVLDLAQKLDPTKPVDQTPAADRTLAMAIPKTMSIAYIRVIARVPVTNEDLRLVGDGPIQDMLLSEIRGASMGTENVFPFEFKVLTERYKFKRERREGEDETPAEPPAPAKAGA